MVCCGMILYILHGTVYIVVYVQYTLWCSTVLHGMVCYLLYLSHIINLWCHLTVSPALEYHTGFCWCIQ